MPKDDKNTALYSAFEELIPYDQATPERNLLRAVLLTAMSDLKKPGEPARRATEFFESDDDSYLFAFRSICAHLEIDAQRILMVAGLRPGVDPVTEPFPTESVTTEPFPAESLTSLLPLVIEPQES